MTEFLVPICVGVVVTLGVGGYLAVAPSWPWAGSAASPAASPGAQTTIELPRVARVLRSLKLVTVEITTSIDAQSVDQSWRGDVLARVRAPVKLYYGVDLARLDEHAVRQNPLTGGIELRVPTPTRLAVEVFGQNERTNVRVGGLRLRDVAGEYHLGLARAGLYERARALVLSDEQQRALEHTTREQVAALLRAIVGERALIRVDLTDAPERVDAGVEGGAAP
jgi:hypothetical protein